MVKIPDFNLAFQDGAVLQGGGSGVGAQIERRLMGDLYLPSGQLTACDPAFAEEKPFVIALNPGLYPVILSVANWKRDQRVACVMLHVNASIPVSWKPAVRQGDKMDAWDGYGVDTATGCFMDETAAAIWRQKLGEPDFWETVADGMDDEGCGTYLWENLTSTVSQGKFNAVIMFPSGIGDGYYHSYWGYAQDGTIACLVTDFGVLKGTIAI